MSAVLKMPLLGIKAVRPILVTIVVRVQPNFLACWTFHSWFDCMRDLILVCGLIKLCLSGELQVVPDSDSRSETFPFGCILFFHGKDIRRLQGIFSHLNIPRSIDKIQCLFLELAYLVEIEPRLSAKWPEMPAIIIVVAVIIPSQYHHQ